MKHFTLFALFILISSVISAQNSYQIFDIDPRIGKGSNPVNFIEFKNNVFFYATDSMHGTELWKFDGNNVSLVNDTYPGPQSCIDHYDNSGNISMKYCMRVVGDTLYFSAKNPNGKYDIYKYDGINTPSVACKISDSTNATTNPDYFTVIDKVLYFIIDTGSADAIVGYNTLSGSFSYINTAGIDVLSTVMIPYNNQLLFTGHTNTTGWELHSYNTLTKSINLVSDFSPGTKSSIVTYFQNIDNKLFLKLTTTDLSAQIYMYDGTNSFKHISYDMTEGTNLQQLHLTVNTFCYQHGLLYYSVIKGGKRCLYHYDPAIDKKTFLFYLTSYPAGAYMTSYNNRIYYSDASGSIYDLKTQTQKVNDVYGLPKNTNLGLNHFIKYNGYLLSASFIDSSIGTELLILYDSTLSVSQSNKLPATATLHPNPTMNDAYLNIQTNKPQTLSIQLTDVSGRMIYNKESRLYATGKHEITIPIHHLPSGTYICTLIGETQIFYSGKLLKQ